MRLVILRGLPGSGKSTLISKLEDEYKEKAVVCSADHLFYFGKEHIPENYKYDIKLAYKAHTECKKKFDKCLNDNCPFIVIDNTNIRKNEYIYYILGGLKYNYKIILHSITGMTADESFKLNVHKVPMEVCERMYSRYKGCNHIHVDEVFYEIKELDIDEIVHNYKDLRNGMLGTGSF